MSTTKQKLNMDIRCLMKCEHITQSDVARELGDVSQRVLSNILSQDNLKLDRFSIQRQEILNAIYRIRDRRNEKLNGVGETDGNQ